MHHYVYLLEFPDGMRYVGVHSTEIRPDLDTLYLGSGKALPPRSPETCNKIILQQFSTREEAVQYEIDYIVNHDCVKSKQYYNLRQKTHDKHGSKLSDEHIAQISERQLGRKRPEITKYRGKNRTPAQLAADRRNGDRVRGTKNPAKGLKGIKNNGFLPWYSISPDGIYTEYHDKTKQDMAASFGMTQRQMIHRFHYTNEHKEGTRGPAKGWTFGNL